MRLMDPDIRAVALCQKPASGINWSSVTKNDDGTYAFKAVALFEKADDHGDRVVVSGIAYAALGAAHPDKQGDYALPEDCRQMAETFKANGSHLNYEHQTPLSEEQARVTKSELSPAGHWVLTCEIRDEKLKADVRSHRLGAYSIEGLARPSKSAPRVMSEEQIAINRQSMVDYEVHQMKLDMQRSGLFKHLSKSVTEPTEQELLSVLADARALLAMIQSLPDDAPADQLARMQAALYGQSPEAQLAELRAAEAKTRAERDAIWAQDEARRLGRIMNPAGAAEADEAERRLREYQQNAAEQNRFDNARARAREERLDL